MEPLKPQPGNYRHYKGKNYIVIGTGKLESSIGTDGLIGVARYSEGDKPEVYIYRRGNAFVLEGNLPNIEHVIYKQHYDSECGEFKKDSLWVRPLEMFLQTVKVDGKEVPRFEYIGKSNEQGTG